MGVAKYFPPKFTSWRFKMELAPLIGLPLEKKYFRKMFTANSGAQGLKP